MGPCNKTTRLAKAKNINEATSNSADHLPGRLVGKNNIPNLFIQETVLLQVSELCKYGNDFKEKGRLKRNDLFILNQKPKTILPAPVS